MDFEILKAISEKLSVGNNGYLYEVSFWTIKKISWEATFYAGTASPGSSLLLNMNDSHLQIYLIGLNICEDPGEAVPA